MSDIVEVMARALETIITRRIWNDRIDGYTLEASKELATAALTALSEGGWVVVPRSVDDTRLKDILIAGMDLARNLIVQDIARIEAEHAAIAASDPSPIVK